MVKVIEEGMRMSSLNFSTLASWASIISLVLGLYQCGVFNSLVLLFSSLNMRVLIAKKLCLVDFNRCGSPPPKITAIP